MPPGVLLHCWRLICYCTLQYTVGEWVVFSLQHGSILNNAVLEVFNTMSRNAFTDIVRKTKPSSYFFFWYYTSVFVWFMSSSSGILNRFSKRQMHLFLDLEDHVPLIWKTSSVLKKLMGSPTFATLAWSWGLLTHCTVIWLIRVKWAKVWHIIELLPYHTIM